MQHSIGRILAAGLLLFACSDNNKSDDENQNDSDSSTDADIDTDSDTDTDNDTDADADTASDTTPTCSEEDGRLTRTSPVPTLGFAEARVNTQR